MTRIRIVLALIASMLATPLLAQGAKPAAPSPAAAYLAGNCTSCHGTDGNAQSAIPYLAGKDRQYLREQLRLYKTDVLKVTLMNQLAKGYSDDELSLLADYYSKKK